LTRRRTREDVLDAALALLDRQGLPGLTMRHLAQDLGVQPSALYWHVADKQTLLAALSGRILADAAPSTGQGTLHPPGTDGRPTWEDALRAAATQLRAALLAHRDGAELVSSSLALGLVDLPVADLLAEPLTRAGATPRTIDTVALTLGHFVIGATFHDQQRAEARLAGVPVGPDADPSAPSPGDEEAFTRGVDLVVAGTAVLLSLDTDQHTDLHPDDRRR